MCPLRFIQESALEAESPLVSTFQVMPGHTWAVVSTLRFEHSLCWISLSKATNTPGHLPPGQPLPCEALVLSCLHANACTSLQHRIRYALSA